jgi:hypothetical protein
MAEPHPPEKSPEMAPPDVSYVADHDSMKVAPERELPNLDSGSSPDASRESERSPKDQRDAKQTPSEKQTGANSGELAPEMAKIQQEIGVQTGAPDCVSPPLQTSDASSGCENGDMADLDLVSEWDETVDAHFRLLPHHFRGFGMSVTLASQDATEQFVSGGETDPADASSFAFTAHELDSYDPSSFDPHDGSDDDVLVVAVSPSSGANPRWFHRRGEEWKEIWSRNREQFAMAAGLLLAAILFAVLFTL